MKLSHRTADNSRSVTALFRRRCAGLSKRRGRGSLGKTLKIIKWVALLVGAIALLHRGGVAGSLDPNDYHTRPPLDFWGFSDTNWLSHSGPAPVSFTYLV